MNKRRLLAIADDSYPTLLFFEDTFNTDRVAGAVIGTAAEPGPGNRIGSDAQNIMSIIGGRLLFSPTAISAQKYIFNSIAVPREKGIFCTITAQPSANNTGVTFGFDNSSAARPIDEVIGPIGTVAATYFQIGPNVGTRFYFTYSGDPIKISIIQKAAGAYYIIGDKLAYVDNAAVQTPNYIGMGRSTTITETIYFDDLRVGKILSGVWLNDYGPGSLAIPGAMLAGTVFSHEPNFSMYFQLVNNGTAGSSVIDFRIQDALNYWNISISSGGVATINEVVAGVSTVRATSAAAFDAERVSIVVSGTNIVVGDPTSLRAFWNTAVNFQTATAGRVSAIAANGDLQNLEVYPVDLSGEAQGWSNAI